MRPTAAGARRAGRSTKAGALAAWLALIGLAGCAARQTIVLVPDPDGRVGQAEVSTAGGKQLLTKASDMTRVGGRSAPSAVTTADPGFIRATFAEATAVEPAPPDRYVLYFEAGTTTLDAKSLSTIPAIAAAARRRSAISVSISGHTDATGADQVNEKLALARAERVKTLLLEQGVAPGPVSVSSHGKGNPAVPTPDGVPEPRNRRVEVVVQ
jgi:outer membrane protein OmpA-like peptidoglycan-associated protein